VPAPYPADTKAKGWRFELDYEAIQQSDTWALADEVPLAQPALLMMWLTAWAQIPCGSFPSDEAVIRAKCRVPAKDWARMRGVLMRGWWLADDGRLYHPTITQRVQDMLARKDGERNRKAEYRARKEAELKLAEANAQAKKSHDCHDLSHGTDAGRTLESHGSDDTGTGTGTGTGLGISNPPSVREEGEKTVSHGTDAGRICKAMRSAGIADCNPGSPKLLTLLQAGADEAEFAGAAQEAVRKKAGFAYALTVVENGRVRAAATAKQIHHGRMPGAPPPPETAHARKMRETVEGLAPSIARRSAHSTAPTPLTIDMEAPHAPAITSH
jgi:uncharacterized protein YdaU (DUF1376 family)